MEIPASELPLQPDGAVYHLNLHPDELADNIILVGDPGRVPMFSELFDTLDAVKQNRELLTHTGWYKGKRISIVGTGMGTDNIDIVLTELDAVANINLKTRRINPEHRTLNIVRVGTSGAFQTDVRVGDFVATTDSIGIDGVLQFYNCDVCDNHALVEAFVEQTQWSPKLPYPYCTAASPELLQRIAHDMCQGITISAPGFFGPQGRQVRAQVRHPELMEKITAFRFQDRHITNMEMESSAIYGLCNLLGHNALTVCLIIANRLGHSFTGDYHKQMLALGQTVMDRF